MSTQESKSVNLGPFLTNSFGDRYLYSINRNVFNQEGSETLYRRRFNEIFQRKDYLTIFLGCDAGLLLQYCLKQEIPEGSRFVFIDLPEILNILDPALLHDLPPQITICSYEEFWENKKSFFLHDHILAQRVVTYSSFCSEDGHLFEYRTLETRFQDAFKKEQKEQFISVEFEPFINKALDNLCDNKREVSCLQDCFIGMTGVVLGGGPSLDTFLPWLKEHQDNVVIFAAARICRQLLQEQIVPHIIVAIDPQEHIFDFCKDMFAFTETSLFIHSYHASSSLISQWGGLSTYTGSRVPWPSDLNRNSNISAGTTVTNLALGLTAFTGCSQVLFGGVDFCFSKEGFSHASGSDEYIAGPNLLNTTLVETNDGNLANTRLDYYQGMKDMESQAKELTAGGLRIINPSPHSARINHVEFLPFDRLEIETFQKKPMEIIRSLLPQENSDSKIRHYRLIRKELQQQHEKTLKFKKLVKEALKCNDGLFGRKGMKADFKYKIRMDEIEEKLQNKYRSTYDFVKTYNLLEFLKTTTTRSDDESWSDEEIEKWGQYYYQACLINSLKISSKLKNTLKIVEIRLEEEKKSPKIKKLVSFWKTHNQHGRAKIWKAQHLEQWQALGEADKKLLREMENTFTDILASDDTKYLQTRRKAAPLKGLAATAVNYLQSKDSTALELLVKGLQYHPDTTEAEKLLAFVAGLQCELQNNIEKAFTYYATLISEEINFLTEDTLRRIFYLNLEQGTYDDALLAAECLAGLSITYAPFLARLHELAHDKTGALEIYTTYLEQVGLDTSVMHKMAKIYTELGVEDGAQLMYTTILEQEPDNKTALQFLADQNEKDKSKER